MITVLPLLIPLCVGTGMYVLCRWLFRLWNYLPLAVFAILCAVKSLRETLSFHEVFFILPMSVFIALAGGYFFSSSTPAKWKHPELKYFLVVATFIPMQYLCWIIGLIIIPVKVIRSDSIGFFYDFMALLSPNLTAFAVWSHHYNSCSLPEDQE
jgi:hypothetical protein